MGLGTRKTNPHHARRISPLPAKEIIHDLTVEGRYVCTSPAEVADLCGQHSDYGRNAACVVLSKVDCDWTFVRMLPAGIRSLALFQCPQIK